MVWRRVFGIGKLSGAAFTDLVARYGVQSGRFDNPEVDREAMRISSGGGVTFLGNIHATFLALPRWKRLSFIRDVVLVAPPEVPSGWADAKPKLRTAVRTAAFLTRARRPGAGEHARKQVVYRELAPGLYETAVIDFSTMMMTVTEDQLATWGVVPAELFDAARANLRAVSEDPFTELARGLWAAPWSDSYDAARLALPEVLQRVCPDPLVAAPTRDLLLVADPRQPETFELLVAALEASSSSPYPISRQIYQLEHKALRRYTPPRGEALARYELMLAEDLVSSYHDEAELRAQAGDEAFWGKVFAVKLPDGKIETRAVWTEGILEGYLPPVDVVCFVVPAEPEPRIWRVPWSVVAAESGMLTPTHAPLPRWKIGAFPSAEWLASNGEPLD